MNKYMALAIAEAKKGITNGHGGPFGCVIVKDEVIVAKAHNQVLKNNDPTSHGEINAIQKACKVLGTYDLKGCKLFTTGEPCPMCLCACMWANIDVVYFGCTIEDNSKIGFRDSKFDKYFGKRHHIHDFLKCIDREECLKLFQEYKQIKHETY